MRLASVALGLAIVSPVVAQPDSPFELVQKLRENGLIDLALMRLNEFKAKPAMLSAEDAKLISYEIARTKLEEASREGEEARRTSLILQARAEFENFIKTNAQHPAAAEANVEIARLYALQAKGQLSKASKVENKDDKAKEYSRARPDFLTAMNRYKGAISVLETRLKGVAETDAIYAKLLRAKLQAELDVAILELETAKTFISDAERKQRGDGIDRAKKLFSSLADKNPGKRVGFIAEVWAHQCDFENGIPKGAESMEKFVQANRANKEAADAIRLAGFFGIQHTYELENTKDTTPVAKFQRTERAADQWLKAYPAFRNTPEGVGARYRLALMKETQAYASGGIQFSQPPKPKKGEKEPEKPAPRKIIGISGAAKAFLEDANKIYKDLTEFENDYTDRAQRKRLSNQLVILEAEGKGGDYQLKSINTLEQGIIAAQIQQARIYQVNNPPEGVEPKSEDEQKAEITRRTNLAISYLERGLQRRAAGDASRDVFDAQMLLVLFLTQADRAIEAAVIGEALARNNPRAPKAATAAQLAIYAYNTAIANLKQRSAPEDDQDADIRRIRSLASFAVSTWPNDGPTDAIRHVLAFYQGRGKDLEGAWTTYSQISPSYPAVAQARLEMGAVMFTLVRPEKEEGAKFREAVQANIAKRTAQWQATINALKSLPEALDSANERDAESWVRAKTQLAQLYFIAGDYDACDTTLKPVLDRIPKFTAVQPVKKDDLMYSARAQRYNALQAKAAEFVKAKEFAKVGEVLDADLAAIKTELASADQKAENAAPSFDRLRRAQRGLLIAAMTAYVQDKKADKANELLSLVEKTGGGLESSVAVMQQLVSAIRGQIDSLNKDNKKADSDELKKSFTEFLDKIRGDTPEKLSAGVVTFLGQGYGAVDQHAKAAELFQTLLNKPFVNPGKSPEEIADLAAKDASFRRQLQLQQARAYRQAGDKASFDKANALMKTIVGDPLEAKAQRGWGYQSMAIRKEYNMLLEDQRMYAPAVKNWLKMIRDYCPQGLQAPLTFVEKRPVIMARAEVLDALASQALMTPIRAASLADVGFKSTFPGTAAKRQQQREIYFDLFYESQRASARAYADPNTKITPEKAAENLATIGGRLFELVSKNDDVPEATKEKITDLLGKHPAMKKKYDELAAAAQNAK